MSSGEQQQHRETEAASLHRGGKELHCSSAKFSVQEKVNFAFHLYIKVLECAGRVEGHETRGVWSPAWSSHSLCWFVALRQLLVQVVVGPLCFIKSRWRAPLLTSFTEKPISSSSRTSHPPTAPKPLSSALLTMLFLCCGGQRTCLTCRGRNPEPKHTDELKALIKAPRASLTPFHWCLRERVKIALLWLKWCR